MKHTESNPYSRLIRYLWQRDIVRLAPEGRTHIWHLRWLNPRGRTHAAVMADLDAQVQAMLSQKHAEAASTTPAAPPYLFKSWSGEKDT